MVESEWISAMYFNYSCKCTTNVIYQTIIITIRTLKKCSNCLWNSTKKNTCNLINIRFSVQSKNINK